VDVTPELVMPIDLQPPPKSREASHEERIELLASTIDECGGRLRFGTLLYRLLYVIAATILFPLLVVIGDHMVSGGLPHAVIFGAGLLWVIVTIFAALGVSIRTALGRFNRLFLARHVEQSRGIPHNPLINLVLLQRSEDTGYASDAAGKQALKVLSSSGPGESGSGVSLRSPGLLLLTVIGVWIIYAAITPKPILPSLARLFGADRDAPTATRIELVRPRPGEPVYVGEPLEIEFALSGRSVRRVGFDLLDPAQPDGPPLLSNSLTRSAGSDSADRYVTLLAAHEVAGDLHYRCVAGDAVARGVIPAEPRADLLELTIDLVPPAYLEEPVRRTTKPELRVWAGTRATFVALANTDVLDPVFVLRGASETRTRIRRDIGSWCAATGPRTWRLLHRAERKRLPVR
jgi:hypothetical protein